MMSSILYFLIAVSATTAGALTGMGGGIIIKPVLDLLGQYDAAAIGVLSSLTVFTMSLASIAKQIQQKAVIPHKIAVSLAIGAVIGGIMGERMLALIVQRLPSNNFVVIVQNICLSILILIVFIYMLHRDRMRTFHLSGFFPIILTGVFLGAASSFLGIGGGPTNVAVMILLFSFDMKTAVVCSIITIFFAQLSKLTALALNGQLFQYPLSMLPPMALGAVLGGVVGSKLNKTLPEKFVGTAFNVLQTIVFFFCLINIAKALS